jgi:hypothetical protein
MADKKISQLSAASTPLAGTEVLPIVQSSTTVKVAANDLTVRNVRANATTGILQVTGPAAASTRVMTVPDANFTVARTDAGQTFTGVQVMTSPNIVTSINDTNGNELIGITATGSAVNELTVANAATGNAPVVSATGSDTNIGITLTPKGTGDVTVSTGNVKIGTAAKGIDFSANTGAAGETGALLNWYEEGTFDPRLSFASGGDTFSYDGRVGRYTRIGRLVTINLYCGWNAKGAGTGNLSLINLPFTVGTYANSVIRSTGITNTGPISAYAASGTALEFFTTSTAGAETQITDTQMGASGFVIMTFSYIV